MMLPASVSHSYDVPGKSGTVDVQVVVAVSSRPVVPTGLVKLGEKTWRVIVTVILWQW